MTNNQPRTSRRLETAAHQRPRVVQLPPPAPLGTGHEQSHGRIDEVVTQPMPPAVEHLRRLLSAVLEAGPSLDDTLAVTEALDLLLDVEPPYPPLGLEDDPLDPDLGIPAALHALDEVAQTATTVRELGRYSLIALTLQSVRPAEVGHS